MSYSHLTIDEVIMIEKYLEAGYKPYEIAPKIKRSAQPVYNVANFLKAGGSSLDYIQAYRENKSRCGRKPIKLNEDDTDYVNEKVREGWNPQVIIGRGERELPCGERTLYRRFECGEFDRSLLPMKGKRKPNGYVEKRGRQTFRRSIHSRVESYPNFDNEFGHLEGDTIVGANHKSSVITLVERKSKVIIAIKPDEIGGAEGLKDAVIRWGKSFPRNLFKSMTYDCGKEFSSWKAISNELDIDIFFADPGKPSQRGLNEHSNGLLRKDGLTKGMDFNPCDQAFLNSVADARNRIPRKSLDFKTPMEVFFEYTGINKFLA
jgi:IS30 family transposase